MLLVLAGRTHNKKGTYVFLKCLKVSLWLRPPVVSPYVSLLACEKCVCVCVCVCRPEGLTSLSAMCPSLPPSSPVSFSKKSCIYLKTKTSSSPFPPSRFWLVGRDPDLKKIKEEFISSTNRSFSLMESRTSVQIKKRDLNRLWGSGHLQPAGLLFVSWDILWSVFTAQLLLLGTRRGGGGHRRRGPTMQLLICSPLISLLPSRHLRHFKMINQVLEALVFFFFFFFFFPPPPPLDLTAASCR